MSVVSQSGCVQFSMPRITSIKVRRRLTMIRSLASSWRAGEPHAASAASITAQLSSSLVAAARIISERSAGGSWFWLLVVISQCSSNSCRRFGRAFCAAGSCIERINMAGQGVAILYIRTVFWSRAGWRRHSQIAPKPLFMRLIAMSAVAGQEGRFQNRVRVTGQTPNKKAPGGAFRIGRYKLRMHAC